MAISLFPEVDALEDTTYFLATLDSHTGTVPVVQLYIFVRTALHYNLHVPAPYEYCT